MADAVSCFRRDASVYFANLASGGPDEQVTTHVKAAAPVVDRFFRAALEQRVSPDLRAHLTAENILHRLIEKESLRAGDFSLGPISINGDQASASLIYRNIPTGLQLSFAREKDGWKIDLLALFPSGEVLLRIDRAVTGESEAQQIERLVKQCPPL